MFPIIHLLKHLVVMKRSHNAKKSNSVVFNDEKYRGLHTWIQVAMRVKKQLLSFLE